MTRFPIFIALVTLVSAGQALADNGPLNNDHDFSCRFEGSFAGKAGTSVLRCHAEGKLGQKPHDDEWVTGLDDHKLHVDCEDERLFDGRVMYGFRDRRDDDRGTLIITGDKTFAPHIYVRDFRFDDDHHDARHDHQAASLQFERQGIPYLVPGECRFDDETGPHPSPSQTPPPIL